MNFFNISSIVIPRSTTYETVEKAWTTSANGASVQANVYRLANRREWSAIFWL